MSSNSKNNSTSHVGKGFPTKGLIYLFLPMASTRKWRNQHLQLLAGFSNHTYPCLLVGQIWSGDSKKWDRYFGHNTIIYYFACLFMCQELFFNIAAKSLQSCPTLCDRIEGSPPGFPVPGILQTRTLEWVAISSPMHKSESEVPQLCRTLRPHGLPPTRFLHPWDFPGKSTGVGCNSLHIH